MHGQRAPIPLGHEHSQQTTRFGRTRSYARSISSQFRHDLGQNRMRLNRVRPVANSHAPKLRFLRSRQICAISMSSARSASRITQISVLALGIAGISGATDSRAASSRGIAQLVRPDPSIQWFKSDSCAQSGVRVRSPNANASSLRAVADFSPLWRQTVCQGGPSTLWSPQPSTCQPCCQRSCQSR